jgi:hypothetical protein
MANYTDTDTEESKCWQHSKSQKVVGASVTPSPKKAVSLEAKQIQTLDHLLPIKFLRRCNSPLLIGFQNAKLKSEK